MQSRLSIIVALIFLAASSVTEADDSDLTSLTSGHKHDQEFPKDQNPHETESKYIPSGENASSMCTKVKPNAKSVKSPPCISTSPHHFHGLSSSSETATDERTDIFTSTKQPTRMTTAGSETAQGALRTGKPSRATKISAGTPPNSSNHTQETLNTMPPSLSDPSTSPPLVESVAYTTSTPTSSSDNAATQPTGVLQAARALAGGVVVMGLAMLG